MIEWNGPNQGKLRKALLVIYPNIRALKRFVRDNFNHSFTDIGGANLEDWAEDLLEKADSEGWIQKLYETFCSERLSDERILNLRKELKDPSLEVPIGEPNASNAVVWREVEAALSEDPRSAHLVIAVFWQERSNQKFRIHPKLCYRETASHQIAQESLAEDNDSWVLQAFPSRLKQLIDRAILKLSQCFLDPIHPWKLTIELFVPVDLLCRPLSTWCGEDGELLTSYPIVMGCSDRFDPDRLAEAQHLHNQLKAGWQRFQSKVPDQRASTLRNLSWLKSHAASQKSFIKYSGFQCYGDWLKPDELSLNNWLELVRSGIPLALWMCEGKPRRAAITKIFNHLTDCTRFEFLERIRMIRDEHQKTCNHCVGVWYEDPHYVPDVPFTKAEDQEIKAEEQEKQFLGWPGA